MSSAPTQYKVSPSNYLRVNYKLTSSQFWNWNHCPSLLYIPVSWHHFRTTKLLLLDDGNVLSSNFSWDQASWLPYEISSIRFVLGYVHLYDCVNLHYIDKSSHRGTYWAQHYPGLLRTSEHLANINIFFLTDENRQDRFIDRANLGLDMENRAYYMTISIQRWLSTRLDVLGNILILGIALFAAGFRKTVDPSKIGVVLSYTLSSKPDFEFTISHFLW